jgi:hypothetical protein
MQGMNPDEAKSRRMAPLGTPTNLASNAVQYVSGALTIPLVFVLFIKTKNFHWHMSGAHFRDYHLLRVLKNIAAPIRHYRRNNASRKFARALRPGSDSLRPQFVFAGVERWTIEINLTFNEC